MQLLEKMWSIFLKENEVNRCCFMPCDLLNFRNSIGFLLYWRLLIYNLSFVQDTVFWVSLWSLLIAHMLMYYNLEKSTTVLPGVPKSLNNAASKV